MVWIEEYLRDYTKERDKFLRYHWKTQKSWFFRLIKYRKHEEMERLLKIEREFNSKWIKKLRTAIVKYKLKTDDIAEAKLLIDTHLAKHRERDFYLLISSILVLTVIKLLDVYFFAVISSVILVGAFTATDRLFSNTTKSTLEEFKAILELVSPSKQ